jgi:hypothetical protein
VAGQSSIPRFFRDLPASRSERSRRPSRATALPGEEDASDGSAPPQAPEDAQVVQQDGVQPQLSAPDGTSPSAALPSLITSSRAPSSLSSSSERDAPSKRARGPDKHSRTSASFVYHFFECVANDTYRCRLGSINGQSHYDVVKQADGSGTSNLLSHLEHRHPEEFVQAKEHEDPQAYAEAAIKRHEGIRKKTSSMLKVRESRPNSIRTVLELLLVAAFITAGLAFSFIQNPFFVAFLSLLKFDALSRTTFVNLVNMVTGVVYNQRRQELRLIPLVSLTADGWSDCRRRRYIGVTAHWVTSDWVSHSCFLTAIPFPLSHTGDAIAKAIHERVEGEFGENTIILGEYAPACFRT